MIYSGDDPTIVKQLGPERVEYPFREQGDAATCVIHRPVRVLASAYAPLPLDTVHPEVPGAYLVSEANFRPLPGGFLSWDRVYATVPLSRTDFEHFVYEFPGFSVVLNVSPRVLPRSLPVMSHVDRDYFRTSDPTSITLPQRQRFLRNGVDTRYLDTTSDPTRTLYLDWVAAGDLIIAENATLRRWRGNIWERSIRYVVAE